jgi:hypothetical protein
MKKFLATFTGIAAVFASNAATVQLPSQSSISPPITDAHNVSSPQQNVLGEEIKIIDSKGNQFDFVLKRSADTGLMMATHQSHSSHRSHSSHQSHYSSR